MDHKKLKVGDLLLFKRLRSSNILTEYHGQSVQLQGENSIILQKQILNEPLILELLTFEN